MLITLIWMAIQLFSLSMFGQKHDYIWVYGYDNLPNDPLTSKFGGAYIDFNESPPRSISINRKLNFRSTAAAMCDSTGKLLFYTNGIAIHNANNKLMDNGDSINYDSTIWVQSNTRGYTNVIGPLVVPSPVEDAEYYMFHTAWAFEYDSSYVRIRALYYTRIDMSANNGEGEVIEKNQILLEGDLGWPAMCKHGNGRDWWLVIYQLSRPQLISFLLSPDGVSGPMIQDIALGSGFPRHETPSKSVFSPDGRHYIRHDNFNGLRIFDFNRCTGVFSNQRIVQYLDERYTWSAAFSEDSHFLYLSNPHLVYAMDMYNINNIQVMDTVGIFNQSYCAYPFSTIVFEIQEGPDGEIYGCGLAGSTLCMSTIEKPKLPAPACEVAYGGFELSRWNSSTICHFPHYRLGEYEGSPCDTLNAQQPDDGFYKSVYHPDDDDASAQKDPEQDYILIPVGHAATLEAMEEKQRYGDWSRVMYEQFLGNTPSARRPLTNDQMNSNNKNKQHDEK